MEKKYQIFISSTYDDLKNAREKVRDAILSMLHFPVGMEMFSAGDEEQWEIIQETIDSSDYYVLIVGQRYGSVIETGEDAGISYTEKEFRYAKEQKVPILAFILSDDADIKKSAVESDPKKIEKLNAFNDNVRTGRVVEWWETTDGLARQVTAALHKQMVRKKRPGWVRGDSFDLELSHTEILKLNQQVRNLQEENAQLKAQIVERKPKLTAEFYLDEPEDTDAQDNLDEPDDKKSIEDEYRSHGGLLVELNEDSMQIRLAPTYAEQYRNRYEPLDEFCIEPHLKKYVPDGALQKYNEELPEKETVDAYIEKMERYLRIHKRGIAFRLEVMNDGTVKATDVRVCIEFPKEFKLFKISDLENIKEPAAPKLPANPIDKAEREYAKHLYPAAFFGDIAQAYAFSSPLGEIKGLNAILNPMMIQRDYIFSVDEHDLSVEFDQILHKTRCWLDGLYIVPTAKGKFKAKISMMCSEYPDWEERYLVIEVI